MIRMSNKTFSVGRCCWVAILGAAFLLGQTAGADGEAPMQRTQAPGFYRMMLGDFEITALFDGVIDLDAALLKNLSQGETDALLKRALIADSHKVPTATNACLINTGAKLVLVDAGGGTTFGRGLGHLRENLEAAGYRPSQVDAVLITHLHFDHGGGLIDAHGESAFPNAVVYLAKAENDYWLSEAEPDVPAVYKDVFKKARKLSRDAAKPYVDSSRWKTLEDGSLAISGIKPVAIPSHTPGHTAYEVQSKGQTLLIVGDTVHFAAVQFARPDAAVAFDVDPKQAVATREALFRRIADGKTFVADMHAPFPGIGRLRSDGKNAYAWIPVEYSPLPKPAHEQMSGR
jgi:glyoxylase-like metal-dependent hydrolase (beta-lactamase superfamily II)